MNRIRWEDLNQAFFDSDEGQRLLQVLEKEKREYNIYPPNPLFAQRVTPFSSVKVVIVGQDPYHGPNQAMGLAFSVPEGRKVPPSLRNIYKEIAREYAIEWSPEGSLISWAQQGVFLMNSILTVRAHRPESHRNIGWERLTNTWIRVLSQEKSHLVFMLWGKYAQSKISLIDTEKHCVLMANHPSPLSATKGPIPFMGCDHFCLANQYLRRHGQKRIDWLRVDRKDRQLTLDIF